MPGHETDVLEFLKYFSKGKEEISCWLWNCQQQKSSPTVPTGSHGNPGEGGSLLSAAPLGSERPGSGVLLEFCVSAQQLPGMCLASPLGLMCFAVPLLTCRLCLPLSGVHM